MKRAITLYIFFFLCYCSIQKAFSQKKLALIVAIGEYPQNSSWPAIASINDIRYIKAALKQNGFAEKNIDTLKNSRATKNGILTALTSLAKKATKNDIVFIHFACHGQQVYDQLTPAEGKDEEDGYDEALAPYDSKGRCDPVDYRGENHLRDDDLNKKFNAIRDKIGVNGSLLVLIDACHSGTASRSAETLVSRGNPKPFIDCLAGAEKYFADVPETGFIGKTSDTASNMVVISASAPHQQNYQIQLPNKRMKDGIEQVGSLSYAFYKAATELGPGSDYQLLFDKMKAVIQGNIPGQIPMIEGNTRQQIFSGLYNKEEPGFTTIRQVIGQAGFSIDKGLLNNIAQGSVLTIFKAGSSEPYTEGTIEKVNYFQSLGTSKLPLKKDEAYRVKLEAVNYGDFSAAVALSAKEMGNKQVVALQNQVRNFIKPYRYLSISDNADMVLDIAVQPGGQFNLSLLEKNDSVRWSKQLSAGDTLSKEDGEQFLSKIRNAIRVKYLRSLPDGGELAKGAEVTITPHKEQTNPAEIFMEPGEGFNLKLINNGPHTLFYTIINITADNKVSISVPGATADPGNYQLLPGMVKEFTRSRVDTDAIAGKEVFKVIFSLEPIDLRGILERKKERSLKLSFQEMMDDLFKDGDNDKATRSDVSSVNLDETGIMTVGFTVKR
ncbi:MAG: caspase family protein [Chitinophagaceae bacterium]|nr:caspase family protein [Chitinophagaceae bacterium]